MKFMLDTNICIYLIKLKPEKVLKLFNRIRWETSAFRPLRLRNSDTERSGQASTFPLIFFVFSPNLTPQFFPPPCLINAISFATIPSGLPKGRAMGRER